MVYNLRDLSYPTTSINAAMSWGVGEINAREKLGNSFRSGDLIKAKGRPSLYSPSQKLLNEWRK